MVSYSSIRNSTCSPSSCAVRTSLRSATGEFLREVGGLGVGDLDDVLIEVQGQLCEDAVEPSPGVVGELSIGRRGHLRPILMLVTPSSVASWPEMDRPSPNWLMLSAAEKRGCVRGLASGVLFMHSEAPLRRSGKGGFVYGLIEPRAGGKYAPRSACCGGAAACR